MSRTAIMVVMLFAMPWRSLALARVGSMLGTVAEHAFMPSRATA